MSEKNKDLFNLLFLFSLSFIIRFSLISKGPFYVDTLGLAKNAEDTLRTLSLHYMHFAGFPLTVTIGSIFIFLMKLIGIHDSIFSVNFMSVVFGSLDIVIFYLFSRKILDKIGSLFSSLIFCFLPLHISISTFGMTHPVSIFFHLLGLYYLFLYFEGYKLNKLIFSAVFLSFGAAARLTDGVIIIAAIFLYLVQSFRNSNLLRKEIVYRLVLFLILYSTIILIFYLPMFIKTGLSQFKEPLSLYYYRHKIKHIFLSLGLLFDIFNFTGLLILIAGMGCFFIEREKKIFPFLLLWFFSIYIYYGSLTINTHRYLLLASMPLLIMQGYFIAKFRRLPILRPLIFLLVMINFLKFYPAIEFRHKHNLQQAFGEFIQDSTKPASYIIAMDEGPFIKYYANRKVLYKAVGNNQKDFEIFFKEVDAFLDKDIPIYIITSGIYGYDPKKYFIKTLFGNYQLKYIGWHINEDWHYKEIKQYLYKEKLYKIEKKV